MTSLRIYPISLILLTALFLLIACEPDPDHRPIPEDLAPAIQISQPQNNNLSLQVGDSIKVDFSLADNEALASFQLLAQVRDENGQAFGAMLTLASDTLSGMTAQRSYRDTLAFYPDFYQIHYTASVSDNKGASDSVQFTVSVLPRPGIPARFRVQSFESDTLFSNNSSGQRFGFNFTSRLYFPLNNNTLLDWDIAESSDSTQAFPFLSSPASQELNQDSVFVRIDASVFNYDEASYASLFTAYQASPLPAPNSGTLQSGDLLIIRLIKAPQPQYAIMRIRELSMGQDESYFTFDYKVTTP